jgi:hypothetical protein
MDIEVKLQKNQELTKLIGRRLKDALGSSDESGLPAAFGDGLEAIRRAERGLAGDRGLVVDIGGGESMSASRAEGDTNGNGSHNTGP